MQENSLSRGSVSVGYVMILATVVVVAVGAGAALTTYDNPADPVQVEGSQFVVNNNQTTGAYELVYIGDTNLSSRNTDALAVKDSSTTNTTGPSDWSGSELSAGDVVIGDLTADFSIGDRVRIVHYRNAEIQGDSVVSHSEQTQLQQVTVEETDPEALSGDALKDVPSLDLDDEGNSDGNVSVIVD